MSHRSRTALFLLLAFAALCLTACLPGDGRNTAAQPAGFWTGIWHGWIAPVSLVVGLFKHGIRVYEAHNTGWWYDAGLLYRHHRGLRRHCPHALAKATLGKEFSHGAKLNQRNEC